MTTVQDILTFLEGFTPPELAESWDNVGLLCGDRAQTVTNVLCALDVPFEDVEVGNAQGVPREEVIVADGQLAQRVGFGQPSFFVETLALYLPAQGTAFVGEPPSLQGLQPCGA